MIASHKIYSSYYQSVMLKGKQNPIHIYIPYEKQDIFFKEMNRLNAFPALKTHINNFPVF
jgi:hypothetical protein